MALDWLPSAERIVTGTSGGSYAGGPFRGVLHRTEGSTIEGAVSVYRAKNVQPHLTVDLARRRIAQHLPFTGASRALQNLAGGVETNRRSTIQVEIVGFSADSAKDSDEDVAWFGREVIRPVSEAFGIQYTAPIFYGPGCGWTLASTTARQRMSFEAWNAFNGWCSHQHVPEQSHWDAGEFKINVAFAAAQEDDDMTPDQAKALEDVRVQLLTKWPQLGDRTLVDALGAVLGETRGEFDFGGGQPKTTLIGAIGRLTRKLGA